MRKLVQQIREECLTRDAELGEEFAKKKLTWWIESLVKSSCGVDVGKGIAAEQEEELVKYLVEKIKI